MNYEELNMDNILNDVSGASGNDLKETSIDDSSKGKKEKEKKRKKKRSWKFYAGIVSSVVAVAGIVAATAAVKTGKVDLNKIKKYLSNFGKEKGSISAVAGNQKDTIAAIADTLPLDNDGVLSITTPFGVKPLEEMEANESLSDIDTFYYTPVEYTGYYVYDDDNKAELTEVAGDPRDNDNVNYWQTKNGETATGYIGVQEDYAEFLDTVDDIKGQVTSGENNPYSTPLESVNYEVPDLYKLPAGYELYCEDPEISEKAKLAYIDYVGTENQGEIDSTIYQIPGLYLDDFMGVTEEAYDLLTKGDKFKEQLVEAYEIYSQVKGNMGYEETTNRGR